MGSAQPAMKARRHLLVPIKVSGRVTYVARYAKELLGQGWFVHITLLYVAPGAEAMRGHGVSEDSSPEEYQARLLLTEAAAQLVSQDIVIDSVVRYGDVVFTIFDVAEQLNCHEIVWPKAKSGLIPAFLSRNISARLARRQRSIPVIRVDRNADQDESVLPSAATVSPTLEPVSSDSSSRGEARPVAAVDGHERMPFLRPVSISNASNAKS